MGFGWLLIGYFVATLMSLNSFGAFFSVIGFSLTVYASKKLVEYNKIFFLLFCSGIAMTAISVCCSVGTVSDILYDNMITAYKFLPDLLKSLFTYFRYAAELVFTVVMCLSIRAIADETGEKKIVFISIRNLSLYCVYFILQVVCWLPREYVGNFLQATALPAWVQLAYIAMLLLNSLMIFSCYSKICDENDLQMPQKPSRFAFINKMRSEREQRQKNYNDKYPKKSKNTNSDLYSDEQQRRSAVNAAKKKKKH